MKNFTLPGLGRVVVINLERGELLLESIKASLKEAGIKNAIITSAIGSLQKVVLHRVTGYEETPVDEFLTLEQPMELASLQGIVVDGEPHFHMVVSDLEQAYTGHLEEGTTVLYLVEISLVEISDAEITRKKNDLNIATLYKK